jgi:hypothetical protein
LQNADCRLNFRFRNLQSISNLHSAPCNLKVLIVAGAFLRLIALASPGTGDLTIWKVWSYNAARRDVVEMYGVGGSPPERRLLEYAGATATVDYPPLALYELGAAGHLYWRVSHRRFPNTDALNAAVKLPGLISELGLLVVLFVAVRRLGGLVAARWAAVAYWLNPAALLDASILGYLDPMFLLPAVGALVAAATGLAFVAGGLAVAAVLTKAQGVFVLPAIALALWNCGASGRRITRVGLASIAGGVTGAIVLAPFAFAGALPNVWQAVSRLATHDMLSANACNLWWAIGYAVRVRHSIQDLGAWAALTAPAQILGIARAVEIGYPNPRTIGIALTASATAWALWTARRVHDVWTIAALAAFIVHAYATLSAQVHENHLFAAVPFLVLAAAGLPPLRPICALVCGIVALNLNLFYGFGEGIGYALPRTVTVVDATVVLAIVNCAALGWHAVLFARQCSTAAAFRQAPAPASIPAPEGRSRSSGSCT